MHNNQHVADWVTWLRDPDHKQGTGYMKIIDDGETSYCCLGGACELAGIEFESSGSPHDRGFGVRGDSEYTQSVRFPNWLHELLGVTQRETRHLAHMNDGTGGYMKLTFPQVADVIEDAANNGGTVTDAYRRLHNPSEDVVLD